MNLIHLFKYLAMTVALSVLAACSGGSSSGSGASKANLNVNFIQSGSSASASKAAVSQITDIYIDAIPSNQAGVPPLNSVQPAQLHIQPVNGVIPPTAGFTALTDTETYLFRVTAYNGSTIIYTGQTMQTLVAGNNNVNLSCYSMNGFGGAAGTYSITTSTGTNQIFTVASDGTSSWNGGQNLLYLSATSDPSIFKAHIFLRDSSGVAIASDTGTITNTGTGTSQTMGAWSASKFSGGMSHQYTIASGYRGMALNTDGKDTIYGLQSITTNLPAGLVDLSHPLNLATNSTTNFTPRSITSNGNGQYLITWSEYAAPNYLLKGRFFNQDNSGLLVSPGNEFLIDSSTLQVDEAPFVVYNGTEYFVIWVQQNGFSLDIVGRFVSSSGSVTGSAGLVTGLQNDTTDIAILRVGSSFFLTYASNDPGPNYNYFIGKYSAADGSVLIAPTQINSTPSPQSDPTALAFDSVNNQLLITYPVKTMLDAVTLYSRIIDPATLALGTETQYATGSTFKFGGFPSFNSGNGYFLVTYTDLGTSSSTFYGQRINSSGTALGTPFVIATNAAFGSCNYSTIESTFRCIYNSYSSYDSSALNLLNNLNITYGRAIKPSELP